jgi:hypothetical protein
MTASDPETVETLLGELIAVLAGAYRDEDEIRPPYLKPRRPVTTGMPVTAARREMIPVAARLARAVAQGNRKRALALLNRPRTRGEWKSLAMVLAAAVDPARIGIVPAQASAPDGRQALRTAS